MHGDDVASAGVSVTAEVVSKVTDIFLELLKVAIEKEREKRLSGTDKSEVLSGGEVTYQRLKEGGEVSMLPSFDRSDYKELLKRAKKMDIPVAAIQENGKENTVSVFFNEKDKEAINAAVQDIVREKLKQPEQTERMITIEKEHVEGFQMYCSEHDIPVNFMETQNGVKCIFNSAYEKQIEAAVNNFKQVQKELSQVSADIVTDKRGRPKIAIEDNEQGKKLTVNLCTKAKLERILQERLGYSEIKAVQAANELSSKMSNEQLGYFLSGSRTLEQMDYYEKDIKFDDDNILTDKFSFVKMKFKEDDTPRLTITDESGNFVVLSKNSKKRAEAELNIRQHLKIDDTETVKAIMAKAEKLGFVDEPKKLKYKEYLIERETQSSFTVRGGSAIVRLDLNDRETARKQLMDSFGMTAAKADRIIDKAKKQSLTQNLLSKAKEKVKNSADTLKNKKRDRGSRK